ncbi:MAG: nucleoside triphosphate pyrophosphohydrolase [Actinobacteria bacterium]|nr:nucleoside triphosphate pyrophosphohydrolase [Actinomycetota bacterium]
MKPLQRLVDVIKRLRAPGGCPWDQEQTFESLTPHIIEEAYELVDTMKSRDFSHLKEELGDVLLHVVMLSNMAEEEQQFTFEEVATAVTDKMIQRHPHVFGDTQVSGVDEVWSNWEQIKRNEKPNDSLMDSIPHSLPALMQATKIQKRAARVGFDWDDITPALDKITEEVSELKAELQARPDDIDGHHNEAGDILFAVVNVVRKLGLDAETALLNTNQKFKRRFNQMEELAQNQDQSLSELDLDQMDALWERAKALEVSS